MEAYNEAAYKDYNEKALEKCVGCGWTFLPERLVVHQRSCLKSKDGAAAKRGGSPPPKPDKGLGSLDKGAAAKGQTIKAEKPKEIK